MQANPGPQALHIEENMGVFAALRRWLLVLLCFVCLQPVVGGKAVAMVLTDFVSAEDFSVLGAFGPWSTVWTFGPWAFSQCGHKRIP